MENSLARIDDIVEAAVLDGQAPGVVVAIAQGESVHVAAAGVLAIDGPPVRRDTLFRISSTTKCMTAATVLALVDAGVLSLDEPVETHLPELADRRVLRTPDAALDDTVAARRPITVRDLLTFTWGFGMQGAMFLSQQPWPIQTAANDRELGTFGAPQPARTPDPDTWIARLGELPLMAQPGERWLYQAGSQVLGVLIARACAQPFEDVMRERLFLPLAMTDTGFWARDPSRLATAYAREDDRLRVTDPANGAWSRSPAFADGAGGLVSTVDDVIAFGRMLLRDGQPVLLRSTAAEMVRDQLTDEQHANVWPGFSFLDDRGWGYGVSVLDDGSYTWEGGLGTTWANLPADDLTVVVMTQRAADHTGLPAVCADVLATVRGDPSSARSL